MAYLTAPEPARRCRIISSTRVRRTETRANSADTKNALQSTSNGMANRPNRFHTTSIFIAGRSSLFETFEAQAGEMPSRRFGLGRPKPHGLWEAVFYQDSQRPATGKRFL